MSDASPMMHALVILLVLGNLLALVAGVLLMVAPRPMTKWLGLRASHPLSVRQLTKSLEKYRDAEGPILRYPHILGTALLIGGVYIFIRWGAFVASMSTADGGFTLMQMFPRVGWPRPAWEVMWLMLLMLILLGALAGIVIGGLALMRVETLKRLSKFTNRWVSTRKAAKPIARPYYGIDRMIGTRPQIWGGVIALVSVYTVTMIVWFS
ncbi:MAG: hypothetical protein HY308_04615 [Gammaproteobacteria bacterium]|nr:hypothetical protein [Gammaproteobacteria bacterium]